jgi:hypothetical protein
MADVGQGEVTELLDVVELTLRVLKVKIRGNSSTPKVTI